MKAIPFMLSCLVVLGCTYHSQSSDPVSPVTYESTPYRSEESIGKLRRLAVMPIEMNSYEGRYDSLADRYEDAERLQAEAARYLAERKGYDVVVVEYAEDGWTSKVSQQLQGEESEALHDAWSNEPADGHRASTIQELGRILAVDAVLAIMVEEKEPWGVADGLLNIALLNIPLFYNLATPNVGAWIYETSTGRLVWREEHSTSGQDHRSTGDSLMNLFVDLENAVPAQLAN